MISLLKKWLGKKIPAHHPRLSKNQVLDLARQAVAEHPQCAHLYVANLRSESGKLIWVVGTAVRGSSLEVIVDDQLEKVIEIIYFAGR